MLIRRGSGLINTCRYLRQLEEHLNRSAGLRRLSDSQHEPLGEPSYVEHDINETTPNAAPFLLEDQAGAQLRDISNG